MNCLREGMGVVGGGGREGRPHLREMDVSDTTYSLIHLYSVTLSVPSWHFSSISTLPPLLTPSRSPVLVLIKLLLLVVRIVHGTGHTSQPSLLNWRRWSLETSSSFGFADGKKIGPFATKRKLAPLGTRTLASAFIGTSASLSSSSDSHCYFWSKKSYLSTSRALINEPLQCDMNSKHHKVK